MVASAVAGFYLRELTTPKVVAGRSYAFQDWRPGSQTGVVFATGTWRGADLANPINTVKIVCDGSDRKCEMQQADVIPLGSAPVLSLHSQTFSINQLDDKTITAVDDTAICVRQTLFLDRQAKSVALVRTKTRSDGACNVVQDAPFTVSLGDPVAR
jgi:hypothetical protein